MSEHTEDNPDEYADDDPYDEDDTPSDRSEKVGLPPRVFLYTLDQIAMLVSVKPAYLRTNYIYFYGEDGGMRPKNRMLARNIASEEDRPDWRVAEAELVRWLRHKRFRLYYRGELRA